MTEKDDRTLRLIGQEGLMRLRESHVLIFGLGGVGSYICEALARAGVGHLTLVDRDVVDVTNINRQLYALHSTIGKKKTELAKERCLDIDPSLRIDTICEFIGPEKAAPLLSDISSKGRIDYVADAIDTVSTKVELADCCSSMGLPLICCCGTGNKLHPELFRIADIYDTSVCPLCRIMRHELKKRGIKSLEVCYSTEQPLTTGSRTPASISFVPSAAGLLTASHIISRLISK